MKLTVRDKTFKIELVNNYVHELYSELVNLAVDLSDHMADTTQIKDRATYKEMKIQYRALAKESVKTRDDIVKELLESNGIEYDEKWWKRRVGVNDINDFMLTCIQKDQGESKPSTKK
jgi:hypothetical protein